MNNLVGMSRNHSLSVDIDRVSCSCRTCYGDRFSTPADIGYQHDVISGETQEVDRNGNSSLYYFIWITFACWPDCATSGPDDVRQHRGGDGGGVEEKSRGRRRRKGMSYMTQMDEENHREIPGL